MTAKKPGSRALKTGAKSMLPFQNKNLIGIDIGSYSLKAVYLGGSRGSYTLKAASCFRMPHEAGRDASASAGLISGFVKSQRLQGKRAAAVLSGPSLIFRHLHLPSMPEKDLREAVKWEIRKETAIQPEDLIADYVLAGKGGQDSGNTVSLIAFAARRSDVERTMALLKDSGLEPRVIEAVPTALLEAFGMNNKWENGVNYASLDIGESGSTLAIFKDRGLAFAREITLGGGDITRSIAAGLNTDPDTAEEFKISRGLDLSESETNARPYVLQPLERLVAELHRSFDYYQAQFREGQVAKLFLSGGTARLKGIEEFVKENLGIPVFADDPLRNLKVPAGIDTAELRSFAPCLTVAAGLATRTA